MHLSIGLFGQSNNIEEIERLKRGTEIIVNARKAIGIDKIEMKSFHYKSKHITIGKEKDPSNISIPDIVTSVDAVVPDKIQYIWEIEKPFLSISTGIWNGTKYKKLIENEIMGTRKVVDVTESNTKENIKNVEGRIDKDKLEGLKKAAQRNPRDILNANIWENFFPLVLTHPFLQNIQYKYIGKAKASNQIANVVDIESTDGIKRRLLFDSETNYLLMMIVNQNIDYPVTATVETKYYYTNHEMVDGVLVPRKIKVESTSTSVKKENTNSIDKGYSNIDVLEFKLNPELKESMFEIK